MGIFQYYIPRSGSVNADNMNILYDLNHGVVPSSFRAINRSSYLSHCFHILSLHLSKLIFYLAGQIPNLMPRRDDIKKVLIIGSGPIIIGQACEFDYSGTQACKALRRLGYEIVLANSNPATIMTDPGMADATYIEPINLKTMTEIIEKERPDALLPNLGGQSVLNLSSELARTGVLDKYGVKVIGVEVDAIKRGEDRIAFKDTMSSLGIGIPTT